MIDFKTFDTILQRLMDVYDKQASGKTTELRLVQDSVITLLEIIFEEQEDAYSEGWIRFWVGELDFGRGYRPGMVADAYGREIPLKTTADLFALLLKSNQERRIRECDDFIKTIDRRPAGTGRETL